MYASNSIVNNAFFAKKIVDTNALSAIHLIIKLLQEYCENQCTYCDCKKILILLHLLRKDC